MNGSGGPDPGRVRHRDDQDDQDDRKDRDDQDDQDGQDGQDDRGTRSDRGTRDDRDDLRESGRVSNGLRRPSHAGEDADDPPRDPVSPRDWCAVAAARLGRDQPEAALEAARTAMDLDPRAESGADWSYRLASLAFERLGRDAEAVAAAEEAVRLAPGSWAARMRLGAALRRVPGRWRESWAQAVRAVRYAPEEPEPHVLLGDLELLRGEHRRAEAAYRDALRRMPDHPGARVNLGLAALRWRRPRGHHDPAWPVDPQETGRTRRALETWSRQIRLLLAVALVAVCATASGPGPAAAVKTGGWLVLAAVLVITLRRAHRVRLWPYVPGMLARDLWLAVSVSITLVSVAAYVAAIATLPAGLPLILPSLTGPAPDRRGGLWAALAALVLLNGLAVLVLRVVAEAWLGRPVRALAHFAAARGDRTARRDAGVALWLLAGRIWSVPTVVACVAPVLDDRRWALAALVAPLALGWTLVRLRGLDGAASLTAGALAEDRGLAAAFALSVVSALLLGASAVVSTSGTLPSAGDGPWWAGAVLLGGPVAVFAGRSARAWWRGVPGPWRASLVMCESRGSHLPGDVGPPVELGAEVRAAFTRGRDVVLACLGPAGPRALAVGAVSSVTPSGELRLAAAPEAWEAAEHDPRVAVFVTGPLGRPFRAEVRGVAVGDTETGLLRVTPKQVVVGDRPHVHRGRSLRP
ncbi:tetratricopeptide (TPR) repeat protein [Streptosporangium becharense]|uniref:Tetratricopeptide (TPR) repeat protein n=1 Tax=Streptosporangium becharense TaxID=1816182 RepID=A0A7W9IK53_9ACTN|nr:hypothetical protein [Streptosporangium becharense]MBB2913199.1 tetratricopeptide (TPR) repeat protein [Streptosporangium becharense]MBB5822182.1 tetratricopeptide (TPR) repeat protein [Streptosporangium becharense]